jgi:hypothetical protein
MYVGFVEANNQNQGLPLIKLYQTIPLSARIFSLDSTFKIKNIKITLLSWVISVVTVNFSRFFFARAAGTLASHRLEEQISKPSCLNDDKLSNYTLLDMSKLKTQNVSGSKIVGR